MLPSKLHFDTAAANNQHEKVESDTIVFQKYK